MAATKDIVESVQKVKEDHPEIRESINKSLKSQKKSTQDLVKKIKDKSPK
jgi:hypothetical protein